MQYAKFGIGQIIRHRLFGYRGVIFDVDQRFLGTDEWYEYMAKTRPPKDEPWYHVLVDGTAQQTYVAERNLDPDQSGEPIEHPLMDSLFAGVGNGFYIRKHRAN